MREMRICLCDEEWSLGYVVLALRDFAFRRRRLVRMEHFTIQRIVSVSWMVFCAFFL